MPSVGCSWLSAEEDAMPRFGRHRQTLQQSTSIDRPTAAELGDPEFRAAWEDAEARDSMMLAFFHLRKKRRWSQAELARRLGTTQSAVSEFEKQISEPRLPTLQRWARAFGYRLDIRLVAGPLPVAESWVERSLQYETILGKIKMNNDLATAWLEEDNHPPVTEPVSVPSQDVVVKSVHYKGLGEREDYVTSLTSELASAGAR
ncbi:helix-turn-helix transcriptional regulator [Actinoplanes sp. NPDC023714]|uniref:helix-turn-helix domain-containing protein n=1 Tax=Actinoplanes sp. NPDC023714 TaxID=3154322 RepID=UPI00340FAFE9